MASGATVVDPEVVRRLLARRLVVTDAAVAKHIASILQKPGLPHLPPTTTAGCRRYRRARTRWAVNGRAGQ
ncbi:hypothetical protein [Streptomyces sp. NPDC029041]|uniref:hypothetical protein n=1 Tax=Streptomyces sp. NPDC029041 TaxID=3155727 RepID=UPI0033E70BFC